MPPKKLVLTHDPAVRLTTLHEDEHVLAIAKPAGVLAHPSPGFWERGTVAHALVGKMPAEMMEERGNHNEWDSFIPRCVVHRLDAGTTGVMVLAKTRLAERGLTEEMRAADTLCMAAGTPGKKVYVTLLLGHPGGASQEACITVDGPIGRDPKNPRCWAVVPSGKPAKTVLRVHAFNESHNVSLVTAELFSGRTHQIRVHAAYVGAPVASDDLYAPRPANMAFRRALGGKLPPRRQLLHAWALNIRHPDQRLGTLALRAPLPQDLADAVRQLWPSLALDPAQWAEEPSKPRHEGSGEASAVQPPQKRSGDDPSLLELETYWTAWWERSAEGRAWERERQQWEAEQKQKVAKIEVHKRKKKRKVE